MSSTLDTVPLRTITSSFTTTMEMLSANFTVSRKLRMVTTPTLGEAATLCAPPYDGKRWYRDGQPEQMLWQGSYDEATARWQAARNARDEIDRRGLTYNPLGGDLNGPRDWDAPVPPVMAGNSNSVNRTLVEAMGLRLPSMPYMAPGIENPLLRQQETEQIARNNGLPVPKGGLF